MLVYNAKKVCIVYTKGMEDRVSLHRYKGMYTKGRGIGLVYTATTVCILKVGG